MEQNANAPSGIASVAPNENLSAAHFRELNELRLVLRNQPDEFTDEEIINISVYEQCNRGVVNISTRAIQVDSFFAVTAAEGSGSGSIVNKRGLVLTNYHVVEGAREIMVTLFDGQSYRARMIGTDPDNDIAILQIDAPADTLYPIPWGDSSKLRVGQRILAIGNPFGLERTLSDGIISSLNRQLPSRTRRTMRSIIQIDASLNQGNSGGPLLNTRGQLIGMNTAIATSTGDNAGIGFSIPITTIARIVPQLVENGRVVRPTIGIEAVYENKEGHLTVVRVTPGGPAANAGIRGFKLVRKTYEQSGYTFEEQGIDPNSADDILAVDGQTVSTADDLLTIIEQKRTGDRVELTVQRENQRLNVSVVLGSPD
jgi:S1-C subfamily serine protease